MLTAWRDTRRVDRDFIGSQRIAWDAGKQVIAAAALAAAWLRAGRRMASEHWRPVLPIVEAAMRASGILPGPEYVKAVSVASSMLDHI